MRTVVAAAIIGPRGLLLAQRSYPADLAGRWELPGGKVEPGEGWTAALEREIAEELGVVIVAGQRVGEPVILRADLQLVALRARLVEGEPTPAEHRALRWVRASGLRAMAAELVPADAAWIDDLAALLLSETGP